MGGAPSTDAEAFEQTLQRTTASNFFCMLCDQYGTPYGITETLVSTTANTLTFIGSAFDVAVAGDIILLGDANLWPSADLDVAWDAFQADSGGLVVGDAAKSYPWVR